MLCFPSGRKITGKYFQVRRRCSRSRSRRRCSSSSRTARRWHRCPSSRRQGRILLFPLLTHCLIFATSGNRLIEYYKGGAEGHARVRGGAVRDQAERPGDGTVGRAPAGKGYSCKSRGACIVVVSSVRRTASA